VADKRREKDELDKSAMNINGIANDPKSNGKFSVNRNNNNSIGKPSGSLTRSQNPGSTATIKLEPINSNK
jgi:hypothetical protein